ncbi:MAG TPA: prepilin peptidase, partial [Candidatus Paceibacterota bacterium]
LDLVPIVSFLALRARCRYCGAPLSWQYPLVEVMAGFLSLGVATVYSSPLLFAISFLMWMTLLFLVVYDMRHFVLPHEGLVLAGALGLVSVSLACTDGVCTIAMPSWTALLSGPVAASPLFLLCLVSRGRWMGWGDPLLELGLGWMLGLSGAFSALAISFWSGAIVGLLLIAYSKWHAKRRAVQGSALEKNDEGYTMNSEVPFAPFLVLGAAIVFFFHVDLLASLL